MFLSAFSRCLLCHLPKKACHRSGACFGRSHVDQHLGIHGLKHCPVEFGGKKKKALQLPPFFFAIAGLTFRGLLRSLELLWQSASRQARWSPPERRGPKGEACQSGRTGGPQGEGGTCRPGLQPGTVALHRGSQDACTSTPFFDLVCVSTVESTCESLKCRNTAYKNNLKKKVTKVVSKCFGH